MLELVAEPGDPCERADRLVVALLARAGRPATRAEVQRWMSEGRVRVDGVAVGRAVRVMPGSQVRVEVGEPPRTTAEPDATVSFRIVHEDAALVVVDKPAGLVVHPARGHRSGTLVNGLLAHVDFSCLPDPRDEAGHLRPGIVHRLDRGTSGLLVVAKTPAVRERLKLLFARHDLDREYVAIVVGRAKSAVYDTPHGRDPRSRLRFTTRLPAGSPARRAITRVELVEHLRGASLVRCRLETGRTHQIRVHLAEQAGTPVLGDPLYGPPPPTPELAALATRLGRQALHAATLGFVHPATGQLQSWTAALPDDMAEALALLRSSACGGPGSPRTAGARQ